MLQSIDLTKNEEKSSAIFDKKTLSKFVSSSFMSNRPALRGDVALFDWKQPPTQNNNKASKQSWPKIIFSKCVCYNFSARVLGHWNASIQLRGIDTIPYYFSTVAINAVKCFESSVWRKECFESQSVSWLMFSMFSMLSKLSLRSPIRDGRMDQLVEPCKQRPFKTYFVRNY